MNDQKTVRLVIVLLGLIGIAALAGAVFLANASVDAGPAWGLAGTAVGGLGALLASTKATPDEDPAKTQPPPDVPGVAVKASGFFGGGN
jgi:peptidoglycan/LPS O-acetylase OafA/YrhL